eukprot:9745704-Lingulodinium_polyedra.AAC.1
MPFKEGALTPVLVKAAGRPGHLALHKQKGVVKPYCRLCRCYATPSHLISGNHAKELMVAIRSAKCASDLEEDAETPEVTGSGPPREGQCMEGT